jgi:hypothetical protein
MNIKSQDLVSISGEIDSISGPLSGDREKQAWREPPAE